MKKLVRSVWICALTGMAFLAACTMQSGLTRSQIRQLTKKRQALIERINQLEEIKVDSVDYDLLREKSSCYYDLFMINKELDGVEDTVSVRKWREIDSILWERPIPILYGSPTQQ